MRTVVGAACASERHIDTRNASNIYLFGLTHDSGAATGGHDESNISRIGMTYNKIGPVVAVVIDVAPPASSARRIVVTPRVDSRARSSALQRRRARVALI
jgi:hypothetical protein